MADPTIENVIVNCSIGDNHRSASERTISNKLTHENGHLIKLRVMSALWPFTFPQLTYFFVS